MTFSAANAQSDKDWLETALERTLRLASPWELPLGPEVSPTSLPNAFVIGPDASLEPAVVPEVPWGGEPGKDKNGRAEAEPKMGKQARLEVRLVDDFEDPWSGRDVAKISLAAERPDAREEEWATYGSAPELIDPWADPQGPQ